MKEKLSLIRKAYNFKQSQWLDPTKSFRTFLLTQKLGSSLYSLGCFKNYPIHCFVMSISKSKCDRKLPKLIMKLLLLLNFVVISLYLSNDGPNKVLRTFLLEQKLGSNFFYCKGLIFIGYLLSVKVVLFRFNNLFACQSG